MPKITPTLTPRTMNNYLRLDLDFMALVAGVVLLGTATCILMNIERELHRLNIELGHYDWQHDDEEEDEEDADE